ncbi:MAG: KGK domain protein [Tolypothrix carrinoi HA7290-LM1]|jgi:hypothetical protein|nr:KGK domain protein [Tolypothrix carrinoi HA7290-LM1]
MEENFNLQNCNNDDALSVKNQAFKIGHVKHAIKEIFRGVLAETLHKSLISKKIEIDPGCNNHGSLRTWKWFGEGLDCEVLKVGGKGWQQGKIKIKVTIEFCPDEPEIKERPQITEPESPLEDIRRMANESSF